MALRIGCAAVVLGLAGCSNDREFDPEALVAELNAAGAGLELGEPLESTEEETEVRVLQLASAEGDVPRPGSDDHGSGAVVTLGSSVEAEAEFLRCEQAPSFVCFRVANAVLRFAEISPPEQARIANAVQALASD